MSNCISLISCDGTCPNIYDIRGSSNALLTPYIDDLVQINGDTDCTYYVRDVRFVGFVIDFPRFLCDSKLGDDNLIDYPFVEYKINSFIYNGVQYINTPITYGISFGDFQCLTCNNQNGAICVDSLSNTPNNSNAHTIPINNILDSLGVDIQIFPFGDDGGSAFRIFNGDTIEFELERLGTNIPGTYNMLYNSSGFSVEFEGGELGYLINESTFTCTNNRSSFIVDNVISVSSCSIQTSYPDYIPVTDCDVITIFPMGVSCSITNTLGKTGATRTATLVVTGGTPPYSFQWANGNRTNTISNLPAGTYNAVVRDYFGDYVINTSCQLPGIICSGITITTSLSYTCESTGSLLTGQAILNISTTGGFTPYSYTGSVNNISTAITNNMIVNHGDIVIVETTDTNGCIGIPVTAFINCPPSSPLPPPPPILCDTQVACPNSNTFQFDVTAFTFDDSYFFYFKLISTSGYNGSVRGSFKIYGVDTPNTFLNLGTSFQSTPITWTAYTQNSGYGSPSIKLSNYVEFGFTQLTPINPTPFDDSWEYKFNFLTQGYPNYPNPINGVFWVPGITDIYIDISFYDSDYCVHKNIPFTDFLTLPSNNTYSYLTINLP